MIASKMGQQGSGMPEIKSLDDLKKMFEEINGSGKDAILNLLPKLTDGTPDWASLENPDAFE